MELRLLDTDLKALAILDTFDSLIWTDRYCGFGDFEILTPVSSQIVAYLSKDRYLTFNDSEHAMIIEGLEIKTDTENGNKILVKGRSLESILDRRIVWSQTVISGSLQDAIQQLLTENAIDSTDDARNISRLVFKASTDPAITDLVVEAQFSGDILYDVIENLCLSAGIGFKIVINDDDEFEFELYCGSDRSYDQVANPYVVFSPEFDNIINGTYSEDYTTLKTVTLVAGEKGVGNERTTTVVESPDGAGSDLARREMFTDAANVMKNVGGEDPLTDEEYLAQLTQKGTDDLSQKIVTRKFEGQVEATVMYIYGRDFFMGDVVQVANEYGNEAKSRVLEFIYSQDSSGIKTYPTFSAFG